MQFDEDQRFFLRGINLRNNVPNELPYLPELFTNVDRFLEWIVDNMKGKEHNVPLFNVSKASDPRRIDLPPVQDGSKRRSFNFSNCGAIPPVNGSFNSFPIIPWMGFLSSNATLNMSSKCAVTLVSEWYAVSLAACFSGDNLEYSVLFGVNSVKMHTDCTDATTGCGAPTQRIPVRKVIIHPQFDSSDYRNDIALIQFARAADTSQPNVKPICLPVLDEVRSYDTSSLVAVGQNEEDTRFILSNAGNRYVESTECQKRWDSLAVNLPIENRKMCILLEIAPNNECFDLLIGSSLQTIQVVGSNERHFLRGILELKAVVCNLHFPLVYADTDRYLDWMLENMVETELSAYSLRSSYDLREKLIFTN
ncbi:phenoloxidase-activating factor 3-like [Anopheles gambiae]|uniref:phenoloxidase-activating factor 3-like n=1 Tax=Anopheles gambiae TaxID=7165 RepID=UPI002AC91165|nr:phenoloxidase-activating factor 3-like [Anopheles gambiae]